MVSGVICVDACDELYNPTLKTAGALEIGDVKKKSGSVRETGGEKAIWFRRERPKWLLFAVSFFFVPSLFFYLGDVSRLLRIKNQRYMKRTNS